VAFYRIQPDVRSETRRALLDSYRIHLDIWKVQNDNYFKRVQILMVGTQVMLFSGVIKLMESGLHSHWPGADSLRIAAPIPAARFGLMVLCLLGLIASWVWVNLHKKQRQYLEFTRCSLKNLEFRLAEVGVFVRYFSLEGVAFDANSVPDHADASVRLGPGQRRHVYFEWSERCYPNPTSDAQDHLPRNVKSGMMRIEGRLSSVIAFVWITLSLLVAARIV